MRSKETGRTMLEMIAVIVLIILLSIGSLMGYKQVVARHQATVLHQDIMVEASSRRGDNAQKKSTYDSGLGHKTRQGLAMETERSSDTFTIIVKEVSAALCSSLKKKDWDDALRIKINGNIYKPYDPDNPNAPNQIQCPSGDDNFDLSLIFPYKVSAIEAYQDFCRNKNECMSCQTCNITTGTCQNNCETGTCIAGACVGQACEEGETLVETTCQPCKTDYSATCSSCNSTTTPYWTEDKKCVCQGNSCGTNFYCDTNGACQECPEHATCTDGTFTCDTGYVKSELGDSCVALSCSKGETLVGTACQPCKTDYSVPCSSCNSTTPYWTEDKKCVCHGDSCGDGTYCDANGVCQECPEHATCTDGTFTCDEGYYKSASNDECLENPCTIPHTSPVCILDRLYPKEDNTASCNEDYYRNYYGVMDTFVDICWCDPGYAAVNESLSYQDHQEMLNNYSLYGYSNRCDLMDCYPTHLNHWTREGLSKAQKNLTNQNALFQWCAIRAASDTGNNAVFLTDDNFTLTGTAQPIDFTLLGTINGTKFYMKSVETWMSAFTYCQAIGGRLATLDDLSTKGICPTNAKSGTTCSPLNNFLSNAPQNETSFWLDNDCKTEIVPSTGEGVSCETTPSSNSQYGISYNSHTGLIKSIKRIADNHMALCVTTNYLGPCPNEYQEYDENGNCVCMQGYHESEEGCVMCAEETPYWDGNQCTVCPSETPYWDGSQCVACSGDTPIWNGTECVACPTENNPVITPTQNVCTTACQNTIETQNDEGYLCSYCPAESRCNTSCCSVGQTCDTNTTSDTYNTCINICPQSSTYNQTTGSCDCKEGYSKELHANYTTFTLACTTTGTTITLDYCSQMCHVNANCPENMFCYVPPFNADNKYRKPRYCFGSDYGLTLWAGSGEALLGGYCRKISDFSITITDIAGIGRVAKVYGIPDIGVGFDYFCDRIGGRLFRLSDLTTEGRDMTTGERTYACNQKGIALANKFSDGIPVSEVEYSTAITGYYYLRVTKDYTGTCGVSKTAHGPHGAAAYCLLSN